MVYQFLIYNKANQLYIYICPDLSSLLHLPPSLPPSLSHPSRWSQSTELISLCYAPASHQLSILHLVVYICPCHSLCHSLPFPLPVSSSPFSSRSVSLFPPCPQVLHELFFFFFLDSIYMCQHMVFVFLFLTYFTLYARLQVHPPHYKELNFVSFYG